MVYPALLPLMAHTWTASSRLNWRAYRFKWTRQFRLNTKSGFCACAITFQLASTLLWRRAVPRYVAAHGKVKIWRPGHSSNFTSPSKWCSWKVFALGEGWWIFLRARAQIANTFQRHSFARGNLSLLAPYVTKIEIRCGASYRLAPQQLPDWPASESGLALTTYISTYTGWFRRISKYFGTWEYRSLWDFSNNV